MILENNICKKQNEKCFQDLLAASSMAYENKCFYSQLRMWFAVIAGALSFIVFTYFKIKSGIFALAVGFFYISMCILADFVFKKFERKYQELGAKIQELFDTKILEIKWNNTAVGNQPDTEEVLRLTRGFYKKYFNNSKKIEGIKDWYPPSVSEVPLNYGRLICQRSNLRYDADLRIEYSWFYIFYIVSALFFASVFSVLQFTEDENCWILFFVSIVPFVRNNLYDWDSMRDSALVSMRIQNEVDGILMSKDKLLEFGANSNMAREIQDQLYHKRKSTSTIPGFFYKFKRPRFEENMGDMARHIVNKIREFDSGEMS